jgi:phage shock protein C
MSERSVETLEPRRLVRSRSNRTLAGVCAGLAGYFDIHPAVFRVAFVVMTVLGGAGIPIYVVAALVMPVEGKEESIATAVLRDLRGRPWPLVALGLAALAAATVLTHLTFWPSGDAWVFLLLVGAVLVWITWRVAAGEGDGAAAPLAAEDARRIRRRRGRLALAVAAVAAVVLAFVAVLVAAFDVHLRHGVDERSHVVASMEELRSEYLLGIGELRVDLRSLDLPAGVTRVEARVDIGALDVIVPDNVALRVSATSRLAEIDLLGEVVDGLNAEASVDQTGDRVLALDAHVGLGSLRITRALP